MIGLGGTPEGDARGAGAGEGRGGRAALRREKETAVGRADEEEIVDDQSR